MIRISLIKIDCNYRLMNLGLQCMRLLHLFQGDNPFR